MCVADHYKHERWKQPEVPWDTGQSSSSNNQSAFTTQSSNSSHHPHQDHHSRHKRSISAERHVEVLLVADYKMKQHHHENDLRHYLLTLMSIVSILIYSPFRPLRVHHILTIMSITSMLFTHRYVHHEYIIYSSSYPHVHYEYMIFPS